jgi:hypothetical protein
MHFLLLSDGESKLLLSDGASRLVGSFYLADHTFIIESPFEVDDEVGTVEATGGAGGYSYEIISQTLVSP